MAVGEFDAEAATHHLQDAVRRHDRAALDQLVSEHFGLVSGRSLGRVGKQEWIAAALDAGLLRCGRAKARRATS
jgi:hypothetical protein